MCVAVLCHMQDLSSLTRDWTHSPCSGRLEPESLDYQGGPPFSVLLRTIHAAQVHFNHYLSICKHILTSSGNGPVIQGTRFPLEGRGLCDTESGPQRLEEHTALPRVAEPGGSVPTLPTDVISLVPHICYWGNTIIQCHSKRKIPALLLFSHQVMSNSSWPHGLQHTRPPCPSPSPRVCPISCPSSRRCHPTVSSSVVPFSSCLQSFPASGSFPMSHLFTSGGQSIGASASASVLPMNIWGWFSLGLTGLILLSKGLSRVFNTTVQKHQFFGPDTSIVIITKMAKLTWIYLKI